MQSNINVRLVSHRRTDCNTNYSLPASYSRTRWCWCICTCRTNNSNLRACCL